MLKRRPMVGQPLKKSPPKPSGRPTNKSATDDTTAAAEPVPSRAAMKVPQVLAELEEACKHIGVRLTYEAIGGELGAGGLCKVKGKWRAIFDKRTTPAGRVTLLAPILARFPVDSMPLSEPVRELLLRRQKRPEVAADVHAAS